jgi:serine/threonine-protein kinase
VDSENPYKAPTTNVNFVEVETEVPEDIAKKIKAGWMAGAASAGITLIIVLISLTGTSIMGIDAWALIDVSVIAGLAYGVYRKSRTCAVILMILFAVEKFLMWRVAGRPTGWLLALAFFACYIMGVQGTFQYHSWKKANSGEAA